MATTSTSADGLVDQVVGEHDHPLGVAALRDHLGRGVRADPARPGLAVHQAQADPQHLPDPPLREPDAGVVRHRRGDQQPGDDPDRRPGRVARRRRPGRPTATAAPGRPGRAGPCTRNSTTAAEPEPGVVGGRAGRSPAGSGPAAPAAAAAGRPGSARPARARPAASAGPRRRGRSARRGALGAARARPARRPAPAADQQVGADAGATGRRRRGVRGGVAGRQQLGEARRLSQRPGLDHRAVGQHHHLVAAAHRGEPVRDDDADPVAQQPLGGPLHPRLGDRVHPRGGLVEDHHVRVADQDPGERDQLLLPGGEHVPALAEPGRAARPAARRPSRPGPARRSARAAGVEQLRVEQRDVLGERAGQDLGALRHDARPTGAAARRRGRAGRCRRGRPCPRGTSTARVSTFASVDLPEPVRPISAYERPRAKVRLTSAQRRRPRAGRARRRSGRSGPRTRRSPSAGAGPAGRLLPGRPRSSCTRAQAPSAYCSSGTIRLTCSTVAAEGEREQPDRGQPGAVDPAGGQRPRPAEHDRGDAGPDRRRRRSW